jgi:hypothetical protein
MVEEGEGGVICGQSPKLTASDLVITETQFLWFPHVQAANMSKAEAGSNGLDIPSPRPPVARPPPQALVGCLVHCFPPDLSVGLRKSSLVDIDNCGCFGRMASSSKGHCSHRMLGRWPSPASQKFVPT